MNKIINQDQFESLLRSALKSVGAALIAKGYGDSALWETLGGTVIAAFGFWWSHRFHADPGATPPTEQENKGKLGGLSLFFLLCALCGLCASPVVLSGCSSTPNRIAYNTVASTTSAVAAAVQGYWDFKAQFPGKISAADDAKVQAAYVKYQAAMLVAADAYHMFGVIGTTNAPPAFQQIESAAISAGADVLDLITVLKK